MTTDKAKVGLGFRVLLVQFAAQTGRTLAAVPTHTHTACHTFLCCFMVDQQWEPQIYGLLHRWGNMTRRVTLGLRGPRLYKHWSCRVYEQLETRCTVYHSDKLILTGCLALQRLTDVICCGVSDPSCCPTMLSLIDKDSAALHAAADAG